MIVVVDRNKPKKLCLFSNLRPSFAPKTTHKSIQIRTYITRLRGFLTYDFLAEVNLWLVVQL